MSPLSYPTKVWKKSYQPPRADSIKVWETPRKFGYPKEYESHDKICKIVSEIENADVVIAPIADNKMFYIMAQFTEGDINTDVALHSLSASKLGLQYIFKTEKAIEKLIPIERYYISMPEREDCRKSLIERGFEIDTKLKLAKREFKSGLYIEEILK